MEYEYQNRTGYSQVKKEPEPKPPENKCSNCGCGKKVRPLVLRHEDHIFCTACVSYVRVKGKQGDRKLIQQPGRNEPCLCGSGKKYKKCCIGI